ncbi:DNA-binding SARP family transcriptional activator [Kibdelosporangium banguiense]|uniref:DNA-binding SARP family transcriptional activator n=1 Tax=Kibdelosporangium banguiense TaxID=1365924 RepID=A0ABS4U2D8_9PSEU|nr:BTAD domain-containing putative transcriptional regulator [Kibdelosporangium banguiense]MBP2330817.1 DNA-binding SARP family transcriptional activator [Kibdelosporangium banguiense]
MTTVPGRISRPRLDSQQTEARLTTLVAPAGYGKTTLLTEWARRTPTAWHTCCISDAEPGSLLDGILASIREVLPTLAFSAPDEAGNPAKVVDSARDERTHALAESLCAALSTVVRGRLLLVLDDVHHVDTGTHSAKLLEALCRQLPRGVHLILSSRQPPPFAVQRLRYGGELAEVDAARLAFTEAETAQLLGGRQALAPGIHRATGGWPVAVRLAAEATRSGYVTDLDAALRPNQLFHYLASEIFDGEPEQVRAIMRVAAQFDRFCPALLDALGHHAAAEVMEDLLAKGLFLERLRAAPGWLALMPLARTFTENHFPMDQPERFRVHERAAGWFEDNGFFSEACSSFAECGEHDQVERVLNAHAAQLWQTRGADAVLAAAALIPADRRSSATWRLLGEAHQVRGDWGKAVECLNRSAGQLEGPIPAAVALPLMWMHYVSGSTDESLAVYRDCRLDGHDPGKESRLLSCLAAIHWAHGDLAACRTTCSAAMEMASGHDLALAEAHTVMAMLSAAEGDHAKLAQHNRHALEYAERAGDVFSQIRVRSNRASHHVEAGDYRSAIDELEIALPQADLTGYAIYRALCVNNRGEARLGLGLLDEAAADFNAAKAILTGLASPLAAVPISMLGDVYRLRGDRVLASAAYQEAIKLAELNGTVPQLVPALVGMARLLASDEPVLAAQYARRAVDCGDGFGYPAALVTLAMTDPASIPDAERVAIDRADRVALGDLLELKAQLTQDVDMVRQAASVWRELGNRVGQVRTAIEEARLVGGPAGERIAISAEREARQIGAHTLAARARRSGTAAVRIESLGGFRVLHDGSPVPVAKWPSRKSRDLVKIVVSHRGRPVPRETLMSLLWPDSSPRVLGNRMSVALSTARTMLRPGGLITENDAVRLDPALVSVDVTAFLRDASAGLQRGDIALLATAEAAYTGDFLEEDPYEDWAAELREEARLTYLQVTAALATHSADVGEHVTASRYCLRILERDRYDETAHLALVRALIALGSHGEARRRYRGYVLRMREIDVEPAPYPH